MLKLIPLLTDLSEHENVMEVIPTLKVGEVLTTYSIRSTQTRSIYYDSPVKKRPSYKSNYIERVDVASHTEQRYRAQPPYRSSDFKDFETTQLKGGREKPMERSYDYSSV